MGRKLLCEGESWNRDGRSGDSEGGGGVGGLHGKLVLELLDALGELASDGNAVEDMWAGDGEVASHVATAGGGGSGAECHGEAGEAVQWSGSTVSVHRTVDPGGGTTWLSQQGGLPEQGRPFLQAVLLGERARFFSFFLFPFLWDPLRVRISSSS